MHIVSLNTGNYRDFLAFYRRAYPTRRNIEKRLEFQILKNPFWNDSDSLPALLAVEDKGTIAGQFLFNPSEYYFQGKKQRCFFGCDFYVPEVYRSTGAGAMLAMKGFSTFKPYFAIGVSAAAEKISQALKVRRITEVRKYIWLNPTRLPIVATRFIKKKLHKELKETSNEMPVAVSFPETVKAGNTQFERLKNPSAMDCRFHDDTVIEFSRTEEYINWRFLSQPDVYSLYSAQVNEPFYFVVRQATIHNLNLLLLADYRHKKMWMENFDSILLAAKALCRICRLDGVYSACSMAEFERRFQKAAFYRVGIATPVLSSIHSEIQLENQDKPDKMFATMSDSDMELNIP